MNVHIIFVFAFYSKKHRKLTFLENMLLKIIKQRYKGAYEMFAFLTANK